MPMRWRLPTMLAALLLGAGPVLAHSLVVFATVEGEEILVEARFSNGTPVQAGEVRVLDAENQEIRRLPIVPGTPIRFPLGGGEAGLRIEVSAGDGHENYWILTPLDIANGRSAAAPGR